MNSKTVRIHSLAQGGAGIGVREDGKKLFVSGALPGEVVSYRLTGEKSSWAQGEVEEIVEPSPHRVTPRCPYYDACGGCDLMHLAAEKQAEAKHRLFIEALERIGGIPEGSLELVPPASARGWGYRSRVAFHVDAGKRQAGFLGRRSHGLVSLPTCPVLVPMLSRLLERQDERLWTAASHGGAGAGRNPAHSLQRITIFSGDSDISCDGTPVAATVNGVSFHVSAKVFFQSNRLLLPSLVDFVLAHVQGEGGRVMDLYAGVGTFSAFLERTGRSVVAVEREPRCLELARLNAPHTRFFTAAAEKWRPPSGKNTDADKVDTVIVDPPRTGLEASVPALIASWKPERVIYVSCDSVTLARDLRKFTSEGYSPITGQVFDLYPQTSHYESAVVLDRTGKSRSSKA